MNAIRSSETCNRTFQKLRNFENEVEVSIVRSGDSSFRECAKKT